MQYLRRIHPLRASQERVGAMKELLAPKVTLFLINDPAHGRIWVEKIDDDSVVLAKGLATFPLDDSDVGFLSIRIGSDSGVSEIIHMYRDYGASVTSLSKNVSESYRRFEEIWYTATMIPIALLFGEDWKKLG